MHLLVGVIGLLIFGGGVPVASAETMGFNLSTGTPNDSVCRFKPELSSPGQTETRYCSVVQSILDEDYAAPGRLEPFYNSTVVGWSVVVGPRSSNTGRIGLALRTGKRGGPVYQGAEVLLPDVSPGTRVHFNENLPIEEGAQIALRIGITTRGNAEEASAPLAFSAPGLGRTETFLGAGGEPWGGDQVETTDHQALLLEAEIVSTEDTTAPMARRRFAPRQDLGRGVLIQVRSNERGGARATGKLKIAGLKQSFGVKSKRVKLRPNTWTSLRIPLRGGAARAVKAAEAEGRGVTLKGRVSVADGAGNSTPLQFQVKGR
jgi:hypothetical protein